ncbi:Cof-type HAD-IIB family hydrolase [Bombilactobacillus bombi]|uniref:Cof-type HAD-IIB family hydrolase n=1 Tax=Bombilactobacillus bombi TaxID=1303590 RepID=A0A3R6ZXH6_9LACO|nr:Cof-type HAD-IIB family hydrolase [Bombilactobacillus bombi]RHW50056.1 Cof-type HAD-IIB family hydrolase [Bombilactobacillus bombi]
MKYKLVASDLDETLLNDEKHVGQKTQEAIAMARDLGVIFVPNTGRGFTLIHQTLSELNLTEASNEYVISFNGSAITENRNERVIAKTLMDFATVNTLFQVGVKNKATMHIYTLTDIYVYNIENDEKNYLDKMGFAYHVFDEPSLDFLQNQPLIKMLYKDKERANLDDLHSQIPQDILTNTTCTYSSNRYMEFNKAGINKGKGLLELAEILNIKPTEIIAIGDNTNDLSMIRVAGLGVAVQNAAKEVKDAANYVTSNDYNHDAVAEVIKKFILTNN